MFNLAELNIQDYLAPLTGLQIDLDSAWLILLASGLVLLCAALLLIRSRRKLARHVRQIKYLQNDIRAITAAAIGVGERVLELERRQRNMSERQEQLDIYETAPYEQAITMAKYGADVAELVETCGISESEAELICMMHRLDQTA